MAIADAVNQVAALTSRLPSSKKMIRVSIGAEGTERKDVEALWAQLQDVTGRV